MGINSRLIFFSLRTCTVSNEKSVVIFTFTPQLCAEFVFSGRCKIFYLLLALKNLSLMCLGLLFMFLVLGSSVRFLDMWVYGFQQLINHYFFKYFCAFPLSSPAGT